jgi:hypothetical protein
MGGLRGQGVVMSNYGLLLRDHVTLRCRSIDRIFLQAYVPRLQAVGEVCTFLRWQRISHNIFFEFIANKLLLFLATLIRKLFYLGKKSTLAR